MAAVDYVRQLSNTDLRERLNSYGENVGPVTATTRGVLEKKLLKILDRKNDSSVVTEADCVVGVTTKKTSNSRGKRASIGRKSISNKQKFAPFSSDDDEEINNRHNRKVDSKSKNEFVDPNDSNMLIKSTSPATSTPITNSNKSVQNLRNKRRSVLNNSTISYSVNNSATRSRTESPGGMLQSLNNEFSDDDFISIAKKSPMGNISVNNKKSLPVQSSCVNEIELRSTYNDEKFPREPEKKNIELTPALSTPLNNQKLPKNVSSNIRDDIDASLIQIRKSFVTKKPSPTRMQNYNKNVKYDHRELVSTEHASKKTSNFHSFKSFIFPCSKIILILAAVVLSGIYVYNWNDTPILAISNENDKDKPALLSINFISCLYIKLSTLAGDAECSYTESKWLQKDSLLEFADSCWEDKSNILTEDEIIHTLNDSFAFYFELNDNGDLSSKSSYRQLTCRINQALSVIAFRVILIITVISCIIGGYFVMKKRWTADEEEMRQLLHFVERIIDTLQRHHEVCQTNKEIPPFLPIPHVRDMLIPLSKRKKMGKIWDKAVCFLNSSDSRVRVETQRHCGEDFDVWRWIGVSTPKLKKEKKATNETYLTNDQEKCWQGPAFDEIEKVVRMPIVTPTPCLKIRYMHEGLDEKDEKWVRRVENAVLEKCNLDGAQILHILVDKTSKEGCVYVKCDSLESAGKAFRCMYGNWFDCRLVVVKFVTLARYHQRFPDALRCVEPLKSDSSMPSSLNWVAEDNK